MDVTNTSQTHVRRFGVSGRSACAEFCRHRQTTLSFLRSHVFSLLPSAAPEYHPKDVILLCMLSLLQGDAQAIPRSLRAASSFFTSCFCQAEMKVLWGVASVASVRFYSGVLSRFCPVISVAFGAEHRAASMSSRLAGATNAVHYLIMHTSITPFFYALGAFMRYEAVLWV